MTELQFRLEAEYQAGCESFSDIHAHLPLLRKLADRCDHVTEFGVRDGQSSRAFLASRATHVRMYDLLLNDSVTELVEFCVQHARDVLYEQADTTTFVIEPTDMLFIDTLHTYDQIKTELHKHAWKVRRYLAFHDTHTFGTQDEPGYSGPGLLPAILTFMSEVKYWRVIYHTHDCNGLTVLERMQQL